MDRKGKITGRLAGRRFGRGSRSIGSSHKRRSHDVIGRPSSSPSVRASVLTNRQIRLFRPTLRRAVQKEETIFLFALHLLSSKGKKKKYVVGQWFVVTTFFTCHSIKRIQSIFSGRKGNNIREFIYRRLHRQRKSFNLKECVYSLYV